MEELHKAKVFVYQYVTDSFFCRRKFIIVYEWKIFISLFI